MPESAFESAAVAPIRATTGAESPCNGAVAQRPTVAATTTQTVIWARVSRCAGGAARESAMRRVSAGANSRRINSTAARQVVSAKGSVSADHSSMPRDRPVACAMASAAITWAPAPISEPPAESRITAGNSSAKGRLSLGSGSRSTSTRKTGSSSAARPEVEGIAKAVATITDATP